MKTSEKYDFGCITDIPMTENLVVDVGIIIEEFRSALRSVCMRNEKMRQDELLENKKMRHEDLKRYQERADSDVREKSNLILENEKLKEQLRVALEPKKEAR